MNTSSLDGSTQENDPESNCYPMNLGKHIIEPNAIQYIWNLSYIQALNDIQNLLNHSLSNKFQQPMTYQMLNIMGYCGCNFHSHGLLAQNLN